MIDGANEFQLLFRIYLPMNWGITTALAIITFIGAWNLFLWPFLAVSSEDKMNITVGITQVHDAFGVQYGARPRGRHARGAAGRARLSHLPAPGDAGDHAVGGDQGMSAAGATSGSEAAAGPHVELRRVTKRYGSVTAITDLSLTVDKGSFTALLGPSGCGKSTLLRMIAGLEPITAGQCFIDNMDVTDVPPAQRRIAMVFQSYALYPHMTVRQNIAFSLSVAGQPRKVQDERALEVARILQLEPYLDRRPAELSGGQRQRVAIGRALVRKPEVFLFDEPLSNLDAKLRVQMRLELAKLHADLGTTMIYVTHDQTEAMTLADKIVVLDKGIISQVGSPLELYNAPANKFVAAFIGSPSMNFFGVDIAAIERPNGERRSAGRTNGRGRRQRRVAGAGSAELGVRPEHLAIVDPNDPRAAFAGAVAIIEHLGNSTHPLCRHAGRTADRRGRGQPRREIRSSRRPQAQREPRASVRRNGRDALIRRAATTCPMRSRLGRQPQHDVLIVIAEAAAEDVDAAGMARVRLDLDPQPNRMVGGDVEILRRQRRDSQRRRRTRRRASPASSSACRIGCPSASTSRAYRAPADRRNRRGWSRRRAPGR